MSEQTVGVVKTKLKLSYLKIVNVLGEYKGLLGR